MSSTLVTSLDASAPAQFTGTGPVVITVEAVLAAQLTIEVDPAASRVYGARVAGTTITVACPTATIGTVSYPTTETWEASVSAAASGANVITASDGTDSVALTVVGTILPIVDQIPSPNSSEPIVLMGRVPSLLEALPGLVVGTATATGDLSIPIALAGSASGTATLSADLSTPAKLEGSATGAAAASGDLTPSVVLEVTAEPHVTAIPSPVTDEPIIVSGIVPPWAVLEGGAQGTGEATGDLSLLTLAGDAIADSDAGADLTAVATHALEGAAVASSAASLAAGTHTYPVVDVLLSASERTVNLHHGRSDVDLSPSERTVILERRTA